MYVWETLSSPTIAESSQLSCERVRISSTQGAYFAREAFQSRPCMPAS
jgi:hypothetical protein